MAYKVFFGGEGRPCHVVSPDYGTALMVALAMQQGGFAVGIQNLDTYEIVWQGAIKGRKLLPQDYDAGLLPISNFPRNSHQWRGYPTGNYVNIDRHALRPGFEREGALDRPEYMAAGSHGPHGYKEEYIG